MWTHKAGGGGKGAHGWQGQSRKCSAKIEKDQEKSEVMEYK